MAKMEQTVRFLVEWTPWADVTAAAKPLGWTEGDSAADFVEVNDFTVERTFSSFDAAVAFARTVIEADTWACPLIHRQELTKHDTDDLGRRVKSWLEWDTEGSWECSADDKPDEAQPSYFDMAA